MSHKKFQIPYLNFGGKGNNIHFAHANAYPPGCYQQLITPLLDRYRVIGMHQRPLWPDSNPTTFRHWHQLADDLILFLEQQNIKQVIGGGHSMGGVVSIIAAIKRPDLFSKLILIDPVIFDWKYAIVTTLLPFFLRKKIVPIAKLSAKRRDLWDNQQTVYDSFRKKKVFKRFSDTALWDFVKASTKPNGQGQITLSFPKSWETQIYLTAPYILNKLLALKIPIIAVKGEYSNVITPAVWTAWQAAQPKNHFLEVPNSGHLVPMEYPQEVAEFILRSL